MGNRQGKGKEKGKEKERSIFFVLLFPLPIAHCLLPVSHCLF
jgi:hypothetical protein